MGKTTKTKRKKQMKSIEQIWSVSPEDAKKTKLERKLKSLHREGSAAVDRAVDAVEDAKEERDAYILNALQLDKPSFKGITSHVNSVKCAEGQLKAVTAAFDALFPSREG